MIPIRLRPDRKGRRSLRPAARPRPRQVRRRYEHGSYPALFASVAAPLDGLLSVPFVGELCGKIESIETEFCPAEEAILVERSRRF